MAAQDELFQLIKCLTPSEKRYFKVNGDSKSNYMQLFDAMDKQKEEYDEDILKKKNAKKSFIKYLSAEKKQLREQIMKHMRVYHADSRVDNKINELLQDERFYRDKGLNNLCEKVLLKAKNLAREHERLHLLKEILDRQLAHVMEFEKKKLTEPVINLINEQKQLTIIQETALELNTKNREIFSMYRSGADMEDVNISNRIEMLISEIERYRPRLGDWFMLQVTFERAYSNYHQLHRNWDSSFEATKREYQLYQKYDQFKIEDAINYKICLANLMARALSSRNTEWFQKAIIELKAAPIHSFNEEGEVFQNIYFQQHLFYINNGQFEEAKALVPDILEGLEKYKAKINKARVLAFQFNIMIMHFIMHEFKEALKWIEILLDDKSEIKQHQKFVSILLLPIIHFELGHVDLVDSYTRSAYRFLKQKNRLHDFERLVVKFLNKMPFSSDRVDFTNTVAEFDTEVQKLLNDPTIKLTLGMEEMSVWAKSHLTNTRMADILAEKVAQ